MKVKFTERVEVRNAQDQVETVFEEGHSYDLRESSANHWISRKKAVREDGEGAATSRANEYMAEGATAPKVDPRGRSKDDEAAQKLIDKQAAERKAQERKAGADEDSTPRPQPNALSSADLKGDGKNAAKP